MFLYRKFHLSVQFRGTNLKKQTLGQQQLNTTHVAVTVPLFSELFVYCRQQQVIFENGPDIGLTASKS